MSVDYIDQNFLGVILPLIDSRFILIFIHTQQIHHPDGVSLDQVAAGAGRDPGGVLIVHSDKLSYQFVNKLRLPPCNIA